MGFGAATSRPARAIVDPEALVLGSLAFGEHERRLARVMRMWLGGGTRLLSAGRLANLARDYSPAMGPPLQRFAAEAHAAGDPRWARLAGRLVAPRARPEPEAAPPDLRAPATLMLRLRLLQGVGIKADALAFLIGCGDARATIREVASGTGYYERAVRRALEDLAAARFVDAQPTSPVSYLVRWKAWGQLLGADDANPPIWRHWHQLYAAAAGLDEWAERAQSAAWSPYVAASRLRDTFERIGPLLARSHVAVPDWSRPVESWYDEMEVWVAGMAERLLALV
jgi:hypothetical protein